MVLTKVIPPKIIGATLSAWYAPLTNFSPSIENFTKSRRLNGESRSWLIANTVPAELAAELPIPLPGLIPLFISISKPWSKLILLSNDWAAIPDTFSFISLVKSKPLIDLIVTPFLLVFETVISSPLLSRHIPRIS